MKINYFFRILLLIAFINSSFSCEKIKDNSLYDNFFPEVKEPTPTTPVIRTETLKDKTGWEIDTIDNSLIYYSFQNYVQSQTANQFVNVVEYDLSSNDYDLKFVQLGYSEVLSKVAEQYGAVAGINATYELDASFIKTDGVIRNNITIDNSDLRGWKFEGAIFYNQGTDMKISYGTKSEYENSPYQNIFSGSPILIDDYKKVGEDFVGDISGVDLNSLDYEDYRRHQGVRHPRTAYALTENNKLLLITIDGRFPESAGMTAKEVTQFTSKYFEPQYALNMDGGGSTTLYVKGGKENGVVNYPTDNGIRDHDGERKRSNFILIIPKNTNPGGSQTFAGGDGTEFTPYLIETPDQLENMHTVDWSKTTADKPYYFKLTKDINMSGRNWIALDAGNSQFVNFDGDGHIVRGLTVNSTGSYASMFGVMVGVVKNLGLVDVNIQSTGSGSGAIAGYVGFKGPNKPTGLIENCFSSGTISGSDAVGGIAGNVGKPDNGVPSAIRNCFSTATVSASGTGNARAGGISGIVFEGGEVSNSWSGGEITSNSNSGKGAGGISGWFDSDVKGVVSLNKKITVAGASGSVGRISPAMGTTGGGIRQGVNCWAADYVVLTRDNKVVEETELTTGEVTVSQGPYDGETKNKAFLQDMDNYAAILGWDVGYGKAWASVNSSDGYPVLMWLYLRGDYESFF